MNMKNRFVISLVVTMFGSALAHGTSSGGCEFVAIDAAAVYSYCDLTAPPEKIAESAVQLGQKYFNKKMNQVHVFLFNNKNKTPRTGMQFAKMSDSDVEKHQVGIYNLNKNSGYSQFLCKKPKGKSLEKCDSYLKK
jgi:hypothetical protein